MSYDEADPEEQLEHPPQEINLDTRESRCSCGGKGMFLGHENPDSWIKSLKGGWKCQACGNVWSQKLEARLSSVHIPRRLP